MTAAIPILQRALSAIEPAVACEHSSIKAESAEFERIDSVIASISQRQSLQAASTLLPPPDRAMLERCMRVWSGDEHAVVIELTTIGGGYSKQTSLFTFERSDGRVEGYVMRRDVVLHVDTTVRDEYPLVAALYQKGFLVAEPVLLETAAEDISNAFMISRRMPGRAFGGPVDWDRRAGFNPMDTLAEALAKLHAIPPTSLGLDRFSRSFDTAVLLEHVAYWEGRYRQHQALASPTIEAAFAWLREHAEDGIQPGAIVHGDCAFYNMLFDDSGELLAVLDWEMAHLGSPVWDLAYLQDHVRSYGSFDDFIRRYVEYGGRAPSAKALRYYDLFRHLRNAVMSVSCVTLFNRGEPISLELLGITSYLYPLSVHQLAAMLSAKDAENLETCA